MSLLPPPPPPPGYAPARALLSRTTHTYGTTAHSSAIRSPTHYRVDLVSQARLASTQQVPPILLRFWVVPRHPRHHPGSATETPKSASHQAIQHD